MKRKPKKWAINRYQSRKTTVTLCPGHVNTAWICLCRCVAQETVQSSGTRTQMNSIIVQIPPRGRWVLRLGVLSSPHHTWPKQTDPPLLWPRHRHLHDGLNWLYGCFHSNCYLNCDRWHMLWLLLRQKKCSGKKKCGEERKTWWWSVRMLWVRCNDLRWLG